MFARNLINVLLFLVGLFTPILVVVHSTDKEDSKVMASIFIPNKEDGGMLIDLIEGTDAMLPVSNEEFECLRDNIYFEARNQSEKGMEAVGLITMNRVNNVHYPNTICGVVRQAVVRNGIVVRNKCQFSWYCDGKDDIPNLNNSIEIAAWERANDVAKRIVRGEVENFIGLSTHYHATYVSPSWSKAKRFRQVIKVDTHIFYEDRYIAKALVASL